MSKICNDCRFYYGEDGLCRRYPPEWPSVTQLTWCGEWKEKESEKLSIEQVTLDEIMTDPKYEEIRVRFVADEVLLKNGIMNKEDIDKSPAQPEKTEPFYQKGMEYLKGFGKKENK